MVGSMRVYLWERASRERRGPVGERRDDCWSDSIRTEKWVQNINEGGMVN